MGSKFEYIVKIHKRCEKDHFLLEKIDNSYKISSGTAKPICVIGSGGVKIAAAPNIITTTYFLLSFKKVEFITPILANGIFVMETNIFISVPSSDKAKIEPDLTLKVTFLPDGKTKTLPEPEVK